MKVNIRKAGLGDSDAIARLSLQLGYASTTIDIHNRLIELLKSDDHIVFAAEYNEQVVGWIHGFSTLRVESNPFIEIGSLVVDLNYRKQSIGKKMVEYIDDWANKKACKKVRVRCNTLRNESHIFYSKIGFSLDKEQKVFDKVLT